VSLRVDDVTVLDPALEGVRVLENVQVRIEEARVDEVGTGLPGADRVVDGESGVLVPGLVNAHGHAPMTLLRGYADDLELDRWLHERVWPVEAHLEREHVLAGALLACAEMIAGGITAFADMYLFEDAVAQAADQAGMACLAGASIADLETAQGGRDASIDRARALLDEHPPGQGRVRGALAPHAVYTCGADTMETVAGIAQAESARVQTHAAETRREVYECETEHGQRPIAVLDEHGCLTERSVLAHCGWITKAEARRIGEAGASVAHCPTANMKLATGGYAPLPELFGADATVAVGTDGPASNNRIDVFQEAKRAALVQKHHRWDAEIVPAEQVLRMATRAGAQALGFEELGRVAEGFGADLALLDVNQPHLQPLHDPVSQAVYAARAGDVRTTIAAGDVVYHEGEHATLDVDGVLDRAGTAADDLVSKAQQS
jgi:5-methylthioadenosine/S-adenosylhomocysteine deaminase